MPPPGLDALQHVVVVMMENRSFDHMLGSLEADDPRIDGIDPADATQSNPDSTGKTVKVQPKAKYQSQLDPDPGHDFREVDFQLFAVDTTTARQATMQGFVRQYFQKRKDVKSSHQVMYYFKKTQLPVITTLAREFCVFNKWFSSIPGPTLCNRAFAHYGTSFGHVGMQIFYPNVQFKSVYERLQAAGKTAKIYLFDTQSSSMEIVNLLQHQPQFFGTYQQFLSDCANGTLPDYSFIEPNYTDHFSDTGAAILASDQHPDHHVLEGERFIASIYNALKANTALWRTTAMLVTYDEHGGIYDHVPPPPCPPDGFVAQPDATSTGKPFLFDRLGVRVPAVLVSPWVSRGTVENRVFEHASIPNTITALFAPNHEPRSPREKASSTFQDLLTAAARRGDNDTPTFNL
ncbi:MAG TPA: alkaline phosphatase family protein [Vicinamibacterales bacterium]|nr:alkaline phosphatase family protein [Vicinamibacterales bacterium]